MDYFVFNGRDSRTEGVTLVNPPQWQRAEERVTQVTIPGRAGVLTITEGNESYKPYTQGLLINVREDAIHKVLTWLKGDGWLTLSNDPDKRQKARVISAITYKRVSKHSGWVQGTVMFYCHPMKVELNPQTIEVISGQSFVNLGDVPERPIITIQGTGDFTMSAGGCEMTFTGVTAAHGGVVIDCDAREVTNISGTELLTNLSTGEFPQCSGIWKITFSGPELDRVTVKRAQRWL